MQNSNDIGFSPSFSCYSNHNTTSTAAAKVSREVKDFEFADINEEDFEFSVEFSGEKFSTEELALEGRILLPIFNTDLVSKDEVDHDDVIPLDALLPSDSDDTMSSTSSEAAEDLEDHVSSRTFCVSWRHRSSGPAHVKKSRSTGSEDSHSRRWKIKDILRRSNSSGNETMFFLCPKRVEASCKKGLVKSVEGPKAAVKSKTASPPSIHELFYVHKRGEQKGSKMKSYLPYKQDILGFKVHVKGDSNKKLPF
ncbi:uncharacterized protein LOC143633601 [Bidens hawaiensis]|uniref:uncharacterized protein LOC143633601 n=1 Tax=Bidens hawaiensis TaxID=980011 RepID=UPI00404B7E51